MHASGSLSLRSKGEDRAVKITTGWAAQVHVGRVPW